MIQYLEIYYVAQQSYLEYRQRIELSELHKQFSLLNNNLVNFDVVFKSVFPVSLSTMPFDVTGTDNDYLTATASFEYVLYEVREKNQQKLR